MQFTILLIKGKCKQLYYLSCIVLCLAIFDSFREITIRKIESIGSRLSVILECLAALCTYVYAYQYIMS